MYGGSIPVVSSHIIDMLWRNELYLCTVFRYMYLQCRNVCMLLHVCTGRLGAFLVSAK